MQSRPSPRMRTLPLSISPRTSLATISNRVGGLSPVAGHSILREGSAKSITVPAVRQQGSLGWQSTQRAAKAGSKFPSMSIPDPGGIGLFVITGLPPAL